jgi:hypothetical protein
MDRQSLFIFALLVTAVFSSLSAVTVVQANPSLSPSFLNIAGKGEQYYVGVYAMNGSLVLSQFTSYTTVALVLPQGEYIVAVDAYPADGYFTAGSRYAYAVATAPFNLTLSPENITLYGCSSVSVAAKFVNGTSARPSYSYVYPLGDPYWYQACPVSISGYNETAGVNFIEVPNVPSLVYAYSWYPVNLASGSQNVTVNAGGVPVQVRVYYWPTSVILTGRVLIIPPFQEKVRVVLNTSNPSYPPCYYGVMCPIFAAQSTQGGVASTFGGAAALPGGQIAPPVTVTSPIPEYSAEYSAPAIPSTPTVFPMIQTTPGYELGLTLAAGALVVALIGYIAVRRANNA